MSFDESDQAAMLSTLISFMSEESKKFYGFNEVKEKVGYPLESYKFIMMDVSELKTKEL